MKQLCVFLFISLSQLLSAQPKTETRAVWITVNYGLDWPKKPYQNSRDIEQQKDELNKILDRLKETNINLIFLQTRIRGDVIYPSKIEPRSEFIKSFFAKVDYDPLAYAIEACHERGIECHAWFVVYSMGVKTLNKQLNWNIAALDRNHLLKTYKKEMYLDPGNPETDTYILSLIKEIVSNYDIDGIHLDYIRYPDVSTDFPDRDTYRWYGIGTSKDDWRRANVNRLVYAIYDTIKSMKPWVQVSSSVLGLYQPVQGNGQNWTAYSSVYQDPVDWLSKGKQDFIVPMTYYSGKTFYSAVNDWISRVGNRFVVPGLGAFQMEMKESGSNASVLLDQVNFSREAKTQGNSFFRAAQLVNDLSNFGKKLRSHYYSAPALLPPLPWSNQTIPDTPTSLSAYTDDNMLLLIWETLPKKNNQSFFYNLYRSETFPVDIGNPKNLVATRLTDNFFRLPIDNRIESGYYYIVTGFDRYHNESVGSKPVFYVTGDFKK